MTNCFQLILLYITTLQTTFAQCVRLFLIFEQEANNTLEAVDEVSDKLQRNIGIIRTRIQDHFDKLRSVMRKREIILLGAVDHVAFKKEKTLSNQRIEISVSI